MYPSCRTPMYERVTTGFLALVMLFSSSGTMACWLLLVTESATRRDADAASDPRTAGRTQPPGTTRSRQERRAAPAEDACAADARMARRAGLTLATVAAGSEVSIADDIA